MPSENPVQREQRILDFWKREKIFQKSLQQRQDGPLFSFYEGPPFATGLPHYGHLLAATIKDSIQRYKTMQGYFVPRRFGWDCHGLPVENAVEKEQQLCGAEAIAAFGIDRFNAACRRLVLRYAKQWETTIERLGRWVDFSDCYRTMDPTFMESVWWVFAQLHGKGLVYEGFKVVPFSPQLGTPLANFEANLNYRQIEDPSLVVSFPLQDCPEVAFLAWTTTPWTLPANLALAVAAKTLYVKIKKRGQRRCYILAKERARCYFQPWEEHEIVATYHGQQLCGWRYHPPFAHFRGQQPPAFSVLAGDFVSTAEGTGIVHLAPAFGEADFLACTAAGIPLVCPVDDRGCFTAEVPEYAGLAVRQANPAISDHLRQQGRLFHSHKICHRYPFCWRSDTPLIYKAVNSWFVAAEQLRERMLQHNQTIRWVPQHIQDGRFAKWLENARDWAISRYRYWGTPLPIWRSAAGDTIVISSIADLQARTGRRVDDLHRQTIDALSFRANGRLYRRISEVFDCWFESGAMPYAQLHYPFANQERFAATFPADCIAEGLDQTRGWFYTLTVLAAALFDQPPFRSAVVNGIVLAADGNKMSKRLQNYPPPDQLIARCGADALRLYLLRSSATMADDLCFSEQGVESALRQLLLPLWNSYSFFATYQQIDGWDPAMALPSSDHLLDRWILSKVGSLTVAVSKAMEQYALSQATSQLFLFIEALTNWYIRRNRARFWTASASQKEAFSTLYTVLKRVAQIGAPFFPFLSEALYQQLRLPDDPQSVHLCPFPSAAEQWIDPHLEAEMVLVQQGVRLGHALRKEQQLKVRQPLAAATLIVDAAEQLAAFERHRTLISEELNVKQLQLRCGASELFQLQVQPNFRLLGKRLGQQMAEVQAAIAALRPAQRQQLFAGNPLQLALAEETIRLRPEEVVITRTVAKGVVAKSRGGITITFDPQLTPQLRQEGLARELIHTINALRRAKGFQISARIVLCMQAPPAVQSCWQRFGRWIQDEVLAERVEFVASGQDVCQINGHAVAIDLQPAATKKR